jgi:hypothetical protein
MLDQLIEVLFRSKPLAVAASLASIMAVAIPSLVWIQKRRRSGKRIAYSVRTSIVPLGDRLNGWSLARISEVSVWNAGTEIINDVDLAIKAPLAIVVKPGPANRADLTFQSDPANGFQITPQGSRILIEFDYFGPGEGLKVTLLHSNASSVEVGGAIKGFGAPQVARRSPFKNIPAFSEIESMLAEAEMLPWRQSHSQVRASPESRPKPHDSIPVPPREADLTWNGRSILNPMPDVASRRKRLAAVLTEVGGLAVPAAIATFCLQFGRVPDLVLTFFVLLCVFVLVSKTTAALCGTDSVGLHCFRLRVVSFDGRSASRAQRIQRLLAGTIGVAALGLGIIWSLGDQDTLCWHDHVSQSFVSPNAPDI